MSARKIRRAAAHQARKAARKAGFPIQPLTPEPAVAVAPPPESETETIRATIGPMEIPEPGLPFPSLQSISPAPQAAATNTTGQQSAAATKAITMEETTIKILTSENPAGFEALKQSLIDEHQPATATESILVNRMAESHWLETRAQRLEDTCIDLNTGAIADEKSFTLYRRCKTTHGRAFHKCLNDLLKLRREKQRATLGVEAQKIANEKHEMKKQSHYWDVLKKDAQACHQISINTVYNIKAEQENPGFQAQYAAELAKRNLKPAAWEVATQAA